MKEEALLQRSKGTVIASQVQVGLPPCPSTRVWSNGTCSDGHHNTTIGYLLSVGKTDRNNGLEKTLCRGETFCVCFVLVTLCIKSNRDKLKKTTTKNLRWDQPQNEQSKIIFLLRIAVRQIWQKYTPPDFSFSHFGSNCFEGTLAEG